VLQSLSGTFRALKDYSSLMASLRACLEEMQANIDSESGVRMELYEKKAQLARLVKLFLSLQVAS